MTRDELQGRILKALGRVAPEVRGRKLEPGANLRDALDLDSMDVLNFAVALKRELGVEIAETDYPRMTSLESLIDLLGARVE